MSPETEESLPVRIWVCSNEEVKGRRNQLSRREERPEGGALELFEEEEDCDVCEGGKNGEEGEEVKGEGEMEEKGSVVIEERQIEGSASQNPIKDCQLVVTMAEKPSPAYSLVLGHLLQLTLADEPFIAVLGQMEMKHSRVYGRGAWFVSFFFCSRSSSSSCRAQEQRQR